MLPELERRGPDSQGLDEWPGGTALGQRRLAIIDLSPGGHQPMVSEDGQVGLVFNGCIYNFVTLRQELEARGHCFRSQCDTEVLLRGYLEWPIDVLVRKLRGMFAFAVWDARNRKLTMVRDRMGVKPLVYVLRPDGGLAFASTGKALKAGLGVAGDWSISPGAVLTLLEYGFIDETQSIYAAVCKVAPGTIVEWQDGRIAEARRYWELAEIDEGSNVTFDEAVEETERLLMESVRLRLQADVPIGALLSGGIDSSLVCWAMAQQNARVKAFTVGTPGDAGDESVAAAETARRLGIPHETVNYPAHAASRAIEELLDAYGEPFPVSSALGMLRVCEAMKPHATVLLTGDGGDDVYLGYPFFYQTWQAQKIARRMPGFAPAVWRGVRGLAGALPQLRRMRNFGDYALGGIGPYARLHDGLPYLQRAGVLGPRLAERKLAQRQKGESLESARDLLQESVRLHWSLHFTGEFMTKVDGGAAYWSMEARAPFLDHELWDFATKLPAEVRFRGGQTKAILREIVRRRLGEDVANRKKQGFTVPVERWLVEHWSRELGELGEGSRLAAGGWVNGAALGKAVKVALAGKRVPQQLWWLLVLEFWLRREAA